MTSPSDDESTKSPVEATVEALVYAPIGLLFEGASLLPQLVEKGKNHVTAARMIGKFAVDRASGRAASTAGKLQDQAAGVLDFIGGSVAPIPADPAPPPPVRKAASSQAGTSPAGKSPAPRAGASKKRSSGAAQQAARQVAGVTNIPAVVADAAITGSPPPEVGVSGTAALEPAVTDTSAPGPATSTAPVPNATLAIPDYDGLSASHVVNRLAGLTAAELESVRAYEAAHRGRKTILSKVAQLQSV